MAALYASRWSAIGCTNGTTKKRLDRGRPSHGSKAFFGKHCIPKAVRLGTSQLPLSGSERRNELFGIRHFSLNAERTSQDVEKGDRNSDPADAKKPKPEPAPHKLITDDVRHRKQS